MPSEDATEPGPWSRCRRRLRCVLPVRFRLRFVRSTSVRCLGRRQRRAHCAPSALDRDRSLHWRWRPRERCPRRRRPNFGRSDGRTPAYELCGLHTRFGPVGLPARRGRFGVRSSVGRRRSSGFRYRERGLLGAAGIGTVAALRQSPARAILKSGKRVNLVPPLEGKRGACSSRPRTPLPSALLEHDVRRAAGQRTGQVHRDAAVAQCLARFPSPAPRARLRAAAQAPMSTMPVPGLPPYPRAGEEQSVDSFDRQCVALDRAHDSSSTGAITYVGAPFRCTRRGRRSTASGTRSPRRGERAPRSTADRTSSRRRRARHHHERMMPCRGAARCAAGATGLLYPPHSDAPASPVRKRFSRRGRPAVRSERTVGTRAQAGLPADQIGA